MAREAFAVIREGMKGKAGIGKVALYGREYLVKVQPREQGLIMYTLRHANEIRSMEAIDELDDMPATVKPDEVKLARAGDRDVRGRRRLHVLPRRLPGRACARSSTRRSKAARSSTQEIEAPPKVVNLMDALRKSLDTISADKKKPAATVSSMPAPAKKRAGGRG